ncbi:NUDIX hydrolase [Dictyobacter arantiisoli]|uniref:NUDIX hydrolase n=1 Tax=Dictyobacter arantiisoli TaxID=2014874 RepID=A0A5A5T9F4_9CHLR|nr:NUDIX hydrolase [Dictyobacter arantiisoli]GCF07663.1 NUDIX hydrolase [Dictyobacter arantiisoli]
MFSALPDVIQDELQQLTERYGSPLAKEVDLQATNTFDPLNKTDRYGEVCMVIRRKDGRLLTMVKSHYPKGTYRLLTGGISHGEFIFDALLRETQEETGLQVTVQRFLTAIAYQKNARMDGLTSVFYTFAFLLDEVSGELVAEDEDEQVEDFRTVTVADLLTLAEHLEHMDVYDSAEQEAHWGDWGRFRAVAHRAVWEALQV